MAKVPIHTIEKYYDNTDDCLYQLRPDGTYEKISTSGGRHIRTIDTGIPLESTLFDNDSITIAAGTVTAQIIPTMTNWDEMIFSIDLTAADTITVRQSIDDGLTYFVVDPIDMSDGAYLGALGVISADGLFRMPLNCTHVSFTKTGTAAAATVKWRTRIVGR